MVRRVITLIACGECCFFASSEKRRPSPPFFVDPRGGVSYFSLDMKVMSIFQWLIVSAWRAARRAAGYAGAGFALQSGAVHAFLVLLALLHATVASAAASVVFLSGKVEITGRDGQLRGAERGSVIEAGEMIATYEGRVQLRFEDGASLSLQPDSRFRIDEFRFVDQGGRAGADDRGFFSLLKGSFRTITGLIGRERREQYKVSTAVATIGIRGTDYGAKLTEAGLAVSTFGGLVEVCSDAGCVLVPPGETFLVSDRRSFPRRENGPTSGGSGSPGLIPALPPPKPVEFIGTPSAPAAPPTPTGPNYSPATGPNY